jgi:hypothetical protein
MKAITVSALLLIASLSQADAQRNRRLPCFATVCVINNLPPGIALSGRDGCIMSLLGSPLDDFGFPLKCFCPTREGKVWGFADRRKWQCGPTGPK